MKLSVPFYGQSWNLDAYEKLGYKDREEAEYWQRSCCGILCIKMAMDSFLIQQHKLLTPSIKELIDRGVKRGFYTDASGWSHEGLANMVHDFGFSGVSQDLSVNGLRDALQKHWVPIVSIKWGFRNTKTLKEKLLFWKKYGGHLGLLVGFEEEHGSVTGFYVHQTSKILEQNWQARFVPIKNFLVGYTGRGIIIGLEETAHKEKL